MEGVICFSRGSSQTRDWTQVSCTADGFFTDWATRDDFYCTLSLLISSTLWFYVTIYMVCVCAHVCMSVLCVNIYIYIIYSICECTYSIYNIYFICYIVWNIKWGLYELKLRSLSWYLTSIFDFLLDISTWMSHWYFNLHLFNIFLIFLPLKSVSPHCDFDVNKGRDDRAWDSWIASHTQ